MDSCIVPKVLAYVQLDYMIASVLYILSTRCMGTPFRNSLTEEQLKIKRKAVKQRRKVFWTSMLAGAIIIYLLRPFKNCPSSLLN